MQDPESQQPDEGMSLMLVFVLLFGAGFFLFSMGIVTGLTDR